MKVKAPDGSVVEFPDGTPPETIKNAMRKQFGGPDPERFKGGITPTIGPDPNAAYVKEKTVLDRLKELGTNVTNIAGGAQKALLEGMLSGGRGEVLGALDALAGRGSLAETQAARDAELNAVPSAVRLPAEIAGGVMSTMAGAPLTTLPRAAAYGGAYGFNAGDGDLTNRLKSAGYGAAGSAAGQALFSGLARAISPKSSPQVQTLMREGVTPTPGQVVGGPVRWAEEKMASAPLVGSAIRAGKERAGRQFQTGAINRALRFAGLSLPKNATAGPETLAAAKNLIDQGYDDVFRGAAVTLDKQFGDDIGRAAQRAQAELNDEGRKAVTREIAKFTTLPEMKGNQIAGRTAKKVLSDLRSRARAFGKATDPYTRDVGDVLGDLAESFNALLKRSLPAEKATQYAGLDRAFKEMLPIENAATRAGGEIGEFTPSQMAAASRLLDQSLRKGATARGQATGQRFAEAGRSVLNQSVPNSGTADRLLQALLYGSAGYGAYADPMLTAGLTAGYSLPALGYTPAGQSALAALLAGRQGPGWQAAANQMRALAPMAGAAGAPIAAGLKR